MSRKIKKFNHKNALNFVIVVLVTVSIIMGYIGFCLWITNYSIFIVLLVLLPIFSVMYYIEGKE